MRPAAFSRLNQPSRQLTSRDMKLIYACAIWLGMAAAIGVGIVLAVEGSPWLLVASLLGFIVAVGKIGCAH